MRSRVLRLAGLGVVVLLGAGTARAEEPPTIRPIPAIEPVAPEASAAYEKLSLAEAVRRALARHPTAVIAAQEMKRS